MEDKEKKKKLKMSNKKFGIISITSASVLTLLAITVTIGMNYFKTSLDTFLGKGERVITKAKGTEDWDTDYYKSSTKDKEEAKSKSYEVANQIQAEGTILLKNDGSLPLNNGATVTPFGYRYMKPIYGQLTSGGSGKWVAGNEITPEDGLKTSLKIDNSALEKMKAQGKDPDGLLEAPGTSQAGVAGSVLGGDSIIYEYPSSIYSGLTDKSSTALVFIARAGQEGSDFKKDAYSDGTKHYLALTQNEKDTIRFAKENYKNVVVLFESSAFLELDVLMHGDLEVNSILWLGHVGEQGFSQLGKILTGEINPSGRTVDLVSKDFLSDVTMKNFGDYYYPNTSMNIFGYGIKYDHKNQDGTFQRPYIEYQEGMYYGYRYYETADYMDESFNYGKVDEKGHLVEDGAVSYPFGYGLSYTTFNQTLDKVTVDGNIVNIEVTVTNTGEKEGKDVVQLYYTSPYTDYDKENGIEKPITNLMEFGKTKSLKKNEKETLNFSVPLEELASYSYNYSNPDGTKGAYILEQGNYNIELKKNSHDVIKSQSITVDKTINYDSSNPRESEKNGQSAWDDAGNSLGFSEKSLEDKNSKFISAHNLFQDTTDYMKRQSSILSRNDWKNTMPKGQPEGKKDADSETLKLFGIDNDFKWETDPELGNVEGSKVYVKDMPKSNQSNNLSLIDMRGKSYYDQTWDLLLDQINWDKDDVIQKLLGGAYMTPAVDSIGLPATVLMDGVNGLKVPNGTNYDMNQTATYGMMPLVASTWNKDLLYKMGEAIGEEGIKNNIQGLYGPAINIHRNPFSGRIFEYFSEDPVLSGKLASAEVSGASSKGLITYLKHFALNEQETNRSNLVSTWADEQTIREIYLKPFEIAIKEAKTTINYIADDKGTVKQKVIRGATGVMAAQMNIGGKPGHADYALLTELLRDEWGFQGMVSTDYWFWMSTGEKEKSNSLRDAMFRAGSDILLCASIPGMVDINDKTSATAISSYRRAVKNIAYATVNSNAMNGIATGSIISYKMSPWAIWLTVGDVLVGVTVAGLVAWYVFRILDEKKRPDDYAKSKKKKNND